jgi:hypothetical protein
MSVSGNSSAKCLYSGRCTTFIVGQHCRSVSGIADVGRHCVNGCHTQIVSFVFSGLLRCIFPAASPSLPLQFKAC